MTIATAGHDTAIIHEPGRYYLACHRCAAEYEVLVATGQVTEYRAPGTDEEPWPLDLTEGATRATAWWLRATGIVALAGLAVLVALALLEVRR